LWIDWEISCAAHVTRWLSYVPHPTVGVVVLLAKRIRNFQVLHLESRDIVHWNLEIHRYRSNFLQANRSICSLDANFSRQNVLNPTLELINGPVGHTILSLMFEYLALDTFRHLAGHIWGTLWHWELEHNTSRKVIWWEWTSNFERDCDLVRRSFLNKWVDAERCRELAINSVIHDEEFSIRWIDCQCFQWLKVFQIDTLMEITIVQDNRASRSRNCAAHLQIIVKNEA